MARIGLVKDFRGALHLDNNLKKEILKTFYESTVSFDIVKAKKDKKLFKTINEVEFSCSDENGNSISLSQNANPELVIYDYLNVYKIVTYDAVPFTVIEKEFSFFKWYYPTWKELDLNKVYLKWEKKYGKEIADCILNLHFRIYPKINHTWFSPNTGMRRDNCAILCEKKETETIRKTLQLMYSTAKVEYKELLFQNFKEELESKETKAKWGTLIFEGLKDDFIKFMALKNHSIFIIQTAQVNWNFWPIIHKETLKNKST